MRKIVAMILSLAIVGTMSFYSPNSLVFNEVSAYEYSEIEENDLELVSYRETTAVAEEEIKDNRSTVSGIKSVVDGIEYTLTIKYEITDGEDAQPFNCSAIVTSVKDNRNTSITVPSNFVDFIYPTNYKGPDFNSAEVIELGSNAFSKTEYVSSVSIPESVTTIGSGCFKGSHLYEIETQGQDLIIGAEAFADTYMKTIPQCLLQANVQLGDKAFADNEFLSEVDTGSATELPAGCFANCINLSFVRIGSEVKKLGDIGVIENKDKDGNVLSIRLTGSYRGVFENCKNLKTVDFQQENNLSLIGDNCFNGCTSLLEASLLYFKETSLELTRIYKDEKNYTPKITKGIGNSTYSGCKNLSDVSLGLYENVPQGCFTGCSTLTSVDLSKIVAVGSSAFTNCTSLKTVNLSPMCISIGISSFNNCTALTDIDLQDSVKFIGASAFKNCKSLRSVKGSSKAFSCTGIVKGSTFENCESLTEVDGLDLVYTVYANSFKNTGLRDLELPSLEFIHKDAFANCKSLASFIAPEVLYTGTGVFKGCTSLKNVSIPKVNELKADTFSDCTSLESVENGDVIVIGSNCFSNCANLVYELSPTIREVGDNAFRDCINFNADLANKDWHSIGINAFAGTATEKVLIDYDDESKSTLTIGANAFKDCKSLTEASIKCSTTSVIGKGLFTNDTSLNNVYYSGKLAGESMFENCSMLKTVDLPNIVSIKDNCFKGCNSLISFNAPKTLEDIGTEAFSGCESLESINFNNISKVTYNGSGIFKNCKKLKAIDLNSTIISESMFEGCEELAQINTDSVGNLTSIDVNGLKDCTMLTEDGVNLNDVTILGSGSLSNTGFKSLKLNDELTVLNSDAFRDCISLQKITLPDKLTSIGKNCFNGCTSLEDLVLPAGLNSINSGAFSNCSALTKIDASNNGVLQQINTGAFSSCVALIEITLPSSIKIIDNNAFEDCTSLTQVKFLDVERDNLVRIGTRAFYNCNSLNYFYIPYDRTVINNKGIGFYDKNRDTVVNSLMTIYGIADSPVQEYCENNGIKFIPITKETQFLKGDLNMDSKVDTIDLILMKKCILGMITDEDTASIIHGDINNDGVVNIMDLIALKNFLINN